MELLQEGVEPLPLWDLCGMNMSEGQLIIHRRTARFNKNTHMRWRRRDVVIAAKFS